MEKRNQKGITRYSEYSIGDIVPGVKTIGDFITAILKIDNKQDARDFVEEYLRYLQNKKCPHPIEIMKENIGYCFGEGMSQERIDMWNKVCGASHWIMGTKLPKTDTDGIRMGYEHARALTKSDRQE